MYIIFGVLLAAVSCGVQAELSNLQVWDVQMPNVSIHTNNSFLCYSVHLNFSQPLYIAGFTPLLTPTTRHAVLSACKMPGHTDKVWSCGHIADTAYNHGNICGERYSPYSLYVWEIDGDGFFLPPDVAYQVGEDAELTYLVIQVHYINIIKKDPLQDITDSTGIRFYYTYERPQKLAGVLLLYTGMNLPPQKTEVSELAYKMPLPPGSVINLFAYRVHTHGLGTVVSGYRVRQKEWTEIGRRSPQLSPHNYCPTNVNMTADDIVALRCTYYNRNLFMVVGGTTWNNEMCVFVVIYSTESGSHIPLISYFNSGPPTYYWKMDRNFDLSNPPADASDAPEYPEHNGPNDQM